MISAVTRAFALVGVAVLLAAAPTDDRPSTGGDGTGQEAARAYEQAMAKTMDKMMKGMAKPTVGNADRDFASMMIDHHQGAIDMARIELEYGRDPDLKAKAQQVIDEQSKEIEELRAWLEEHPGGTN